MVSPLIVGNWKTYVDLRSCEEFISDSLWEKLPETFLKNQIVLLPPTPLLGWFYASRAHLPFLYGAQTCSLYPSGAYTGEVSPQLLEQLGCSYCLAGHSERRILFSETEEQVAAKLSAILSTGMTPILCVGENLEDRENGRFVEKVQSQLVTALSGLTAQKLERILIAYEPVWAIGTGKNAEPEQVSYMVQVILHTWNGLIENPSKNPPILYGGSVDGNTVGAYVNLEGISGVLVGAASANSEKFFSIIQAFQQKAR